MKAVSPALPSQRLLLILSYILERIIPALSYILTISMSPATTTPPHFYSFSSTTTTPPHFQGFPSTATTAFQLFFSTITTTFLLLSLNHHHIFNVSPSLPQFNSFLNNTTTTFLWFFRPQPSPPPPHFNCFLCTTAPPPTLPHFYCFPSNSTITTFLFFSPTTPQLHFYCFYSTSTRCLLFSLHLHHHISIVFSS